MKKNTQRTNTTMYIGKVLYTVWSHYYLNTLSSETRQYYSYCPSEIRVSRKQNVKCFISVTMICSAYIPHYLYINILQYSSIVKPSRGCNLRGIVLQCRARSIQCRTLLTMPVKWVKDIRRECIHITYCTCTTLLYIYPTVTETRQFAATIYTKYYTHAVAILFYVIGSCFFTQVRESSAEESVNRLVKTLYLKCYLIQKVIARTKVK